MNTEDEGKYPIIWRARLPQRGIVLIPRPQDFVSRMAGLHKDVWTEVDTDSYLEEERDSWQR